MLVFPGLKGPWGEGGARRASRTSSLRVIRTTPSGAAAAGPAGPMSAISSITKRLSPDPALDPAGSAVFPCAAEAAGGELPSAGALADTAGAAELGRADRAGGATLATALAEGCDDPASFREQPAATSATAASRASLGPGGMPYETLPRPLSSRQGSRPAGPWAIRVAMSD